MRRLLLSIVQCVLFLLIFFWIWRSFEAFAYATPTQCHRFSYPFQGLLTETLIEMFSNEDTHLIEILGTCFGPLANLFFLLWSTFGRTSWFGVII